MAVGLLANSLISGPLVSGAWPVLSVSPMAAKTASPGVRFACFGLGATGGATFLTGLGAVGGATFFWGFSFSERRAMKASPVFWTGFFAAVVLGLLGRLEAVVWVSLRADRAALITFCVYKERDENRCCSELTKGYSLTMPLG